MNASTDIRVTTPPGRRPARTDELGPAVARLAGRLGAGDPRAGAAQICSQARFNALLPLVHRAAQLGYIELEPEARARCAHHYFQSAANTQRLQGEIGQIASALAAEDIPLLVLKGSAFVFDLYAEPGVRLAGDLDLLVPPERVDDVVRLLQGLGYALVGRSDRHELRELARPGRTANKGNVDLHTRIAPWRSWTGPGYDVDVAGVWQRALPLPLPGCARAPLQMSYEDALLFVSFQIAQHGFNKFRSYFDLHAMVAGGAVDAARLADLARAGRGHAFRVHAYWALRLTQALLDTPVPADWLACTRPSRAREKLLARWSGPARVLAGGLPEDSPDRYIILARSTGDMLRMGVSALSYVTSRALGRPQQW